ncbi:hypothetical protein ONZ51_g13036 [Trametes cubensis]|uniref:F-box domain-containing protein n=1 Tax=Trametes cubensis TaxID=1111947 RepID=A0AAD7X4Y6_9APHY|nr:hypothetical protein ONZ51_g13036 [Trametes cubensis]
MSSDIPSDIPESIALSVGLKPLQVPFFFSRAGKAARKARALRIGNKQAPTSQEQQEKNPKSKTVRVRLGRLADLMDMPMDIFLEIIVHLQPLDLLHLARASKHFRAMLMTSRSRYLWVAAFQNVAPGLPPCPPYISEPRYAAALFDQYCFACGVERSTNTEYSTTLRLCAPCHKTNFKCGEHLNISSKKLSPQFIETTLPSLLVSAVRYVDMENYQDEFNAKSNWMYSIFYVPEVEAVLALCESKQTTEQRMAFIRERREYVTKMQSHGLAVLRWLSKEYRSKRDSQKSAREERKATILRKLEALGYNHTDYPDNDAWNKIVNQPRELTDRIWKVSRPKLEALIKQQREDDRRAEFEARLRERYAEFRPIYEEFIHVALPDHIRDFAPNWADACRLPCIVELASSDGAFPRINGARVATITTRLTAEVHEAVCQIKRDLVEMLHREYHQTHRDALPPPPLEMAQVDAELAKATSLFICHRCPLQTAVSASQICLHWRTEHPELKWNDAWPIDEMFDRRRKRSEWPKLLPWVCAMPSGPSCAKHALVALGIPDDTPYIALDDVAQQGRLVCLCGSPELPAPSESGWGTLIKHVADEQAWHHRMQLFSKDITLWPSIKLIDNHPLSGPAPCLKLLAEGERAEVPDSSIPADTASLVTARLEHEQRQPVCSSCHFMLKDGSKRTRDIHLPRDITHIAHHMRTRHDETLSSDCILFVYA